MKVIIDKSTTDNNDWNIPINKWLELCDALKVCPDSNIDHIINKARKIRELKNEYAKQLYLLDKLESLDD